MKSVGEEVGAVALNLAGKRASCAPLGDRFGRKLTGVDEAFVEADNKEVGPEFMKEVVVVGKGVSFK